MYEQFFGLSENPFSLTPDPRFIFSSRSHDEALAHLRYWVEHREGFAMITGEVGTGKTTALFRLIEGMDRHFEIAFLTNSTLSSVELLEEICRKFRIDVEKDLTKPALLSKLENYLVRLHEMGHGAVLIIDEAQNFDHLLLEEVRLLSNVTRPAGPPLLQIALVGQPELERKLSSSELRQLKQRIGVHYRIEPLSEEETGKYIHHRVSVANGYPRVLFPAQTVALLHQKTHGLPREINQVASQSLLHAYVEESTSVQPDHIRSAIEEMGFKSVLERGMTLTVTPPGRPAGSRPAGPGIEKTASLAPERPPLRFETTAEPTPPPAREAALPAEPDRPRSTPATSPGRGGPEPVPARTSRPRTQMTGTPPGRSRPATLPSQNAGRSPAPDFGALPPINAAQPQAAGFGNPLVRRLAVVGAAVVILAIAAFLLFGSRGANRDELADLEAEATMPQPPKSNPTPTFPPVSGTDLSAGGVAATPQTGNTAPGVVSGGTTPGTGGEVPSVTESRTPVSAPVTGPPRDSIEHKPPVPAGSNPVMAAWHLQVASLRDSSSATSVGRRLGRISGASFHVDRSSGGNFPWYGVYLGPYGTRAEAESARVDLARVEPSATGSIIRPPSN